ncbi:hypothetical protein JTB14_017339 [Gonioctena quinquepunctata]|nr:hypothetical protein JTB14_017339 [Gonioctena quinquepunctata]
MACAPECSCAEEVKELTVADISTTMTEKPQDGGRPKQMMTRDVPKESRKEMIKFVKGKKKRFPDCLSRLPLKITTETEEQSVAGYLYFATTVSDWPIDNHQVRNATKTDEELDEILGYIRNGWPQRMDETFKPFWNRREELIEDDCILWGKRIIIAKKLRQKMLTELHVSRLCMVKTKSMARSYLWWPNIDQDIETMIKS